ncbi:MAG: hypothetical protein QOG62_100 [Thermoleophilaceae bacterium]|nr:hypothetical protein [Thermoleophilaceae bacterium]
MDISARQKRLILVAAILGSGIVFLDGSVVNVALPAISDELHAGLSAQQWVIDAYLLTLSSFLLLGGSLGDMFGRRRVFELGLIGFGVTSLLCAVAPTADLLIVARALQGIDGALLVPSSLAIITSTFQDHERTQAIGTWTAWTGVSFVIGPLLGGVLIDLASWRWVFAINVPFVIGTVLLLRTTCPDLKVEHRAHVDWLGAILCALGLAGPVYALIEQPTYGWLHPMVVIPMVAGVLLLVAFVLWERRAKEPMVTLSLFAERNFTVTNIATLAIYAGLASMTFFTVLFLQQVAGYSALQSGLALMPITLIMLLLARWFGGLSDRMGPRFFMSAGPFVATAGLLLSLRIGGQADYLAEVLPSIIVFGIGLSMTVAPLTATVLASAPAEHAGVASGINNAVSRVASLLAVAGVGAVVAVGYGAALDQGMSGIELAPDGKAELAQMHTRSLSIPAANAQLDDGDRQVLTQAGTAASVSAFHMGMGIAALLVLIGGIIAAVGIRNHAEPQPDG